MLFVNYTTKMGRKLSLAKFQNGYSDEMGRLDDEMN